MSASRKPPGPHGRAGGAAGRRPRDPSRTAEGRSPTSGAEAAPFDPLPGRGFSEEELELGHVVGVFGVRGEVRVHLHNPGSDLLARGSEVVLVDPGGRRHRARLRTRDGAGKRVLGRLDGVGDRDRAAALKGWRFGVSKDALPALDEGAFYVWQLVGADVHEGEADAPDLPVVGTLVDVQETAAHDVLVVEASDGELHFVPCVHEWVVLLDVEDGRLVLRPGALDPW